LLVFTPPETFAPVMGPTLPMLPMQPALRIAAAREIASGDFKIVAISTPVVFAKNWGTARSPRRRTPLVQGPRGQIFQ
jgi:hypothetical protein